MTTNPLYAFLSLQPGQGVRQIRRGRQRAWCRSRCSAGCRPSATAAPAPTPGAPVRLGWRWPRPLVSWVSRGPPGRLTARTPVSPLLLPCHTQHQEIRQRLNPRGPLVFDTRTLGPGPRASRTVRSRLPPTWEPGWSACPKVPTFELEVQLEGVSEGVLVTATASAPLVGRVRALPGASSPPAPRSGSGACSPYEEAPTRTVATGTFWTGTCWTWSRRCGMRWCSGCRCRRCAPSDCPGLCSECGARLAEAGSEHVHSQAGVPAQPAGRVDQTPDGIAVPELRKEP